MPTPLLNWGTPLAVDSELAAPAPDAAAAAFLAVTSGLVMQRRIYTDKHHF